MKRGKFISERSKPFDTNIWKPSLQSVSLYIRCYKTQTQKIILDLIVNSKLSVSIVTASQTGSEKHKKSEIFLLKTGPVQVRGWTTIEPVWLIKRYFQYEFACCPPNRLKGLQPGDPLHPSHHPVHPLQPPHHAVVHIAVAALRYVRPPVLPNTNLHCLISMDGNTFK